MNSITKSKDILLICKGWYNKDKSDNELEALKAYQSMRTGCESKYITIDNIYTWLLETATDFFTPYDWWTIFHNKIPSDLRMNKYSPEYYPHVELNIEYLCSLFIRTLCGLDVKNNNGTCIIDLSKYENVKEII